MKKAPKILLALAVAILLPCSGALAAGEDLMKRMSEILQKAPAEGEYQIKAEIPDVKKEDVKVTLEEGVLTIQGERKQEKEEKGKRYHRVERSYGRFVRSFTLPDVVDEEKVKAEFKDGILNLALPKSEKAKPKAIEVKVG